MNRALIAVVCLCGVAGLAGGWLVSGPGDGPVPTQTRETRKPPLDPAPNASPARIEFALRPEDVANDRETPALAVTPGGGVVLAWAAQAGETTRVLRVARSADGGKTFAPATDFRMVPIYKYTSQSKGKTAAYSTHVLPRLALTAEGLFLGWVEAVKGGPEVAFFVARSEDGGMTFGEPVRVHGSDAKKPGFTALTASADGTLLAAWLDGRDKGQQPFFASKPATSDGFDADRKVFAGPEGKGICPCCDIAPLRLPDGSDLVAFRNSDSGHRDIWLARARRGQASAPPFPLTADRWTFEGCPHDGPSLTLDGETIHAAWMSAHSGRNRVYAASSPAADLAFTPYEPGAGTAGAQGHPKLAHVGDGTLLLVWDESLDPAAESPAPKATHEGHKGHGPALVGHGRAVMLARKGKNDARFGPGRAVAPRPGSFQLNPAITVGPDGVPLIAWSEIDTKGKRIALVRLEPEARTP